MARMKQVFPTWQVPEIWVQQSQDHGHNPQNNLFFNGSTIFSYGRHFSIATFVSHPKRGSAVLLTRQKYSVTTNLHIEAVRNAIRHEKVFEVLDVLDEAWNPDSSFHKSVLDETWKEYTVDIETALGKSKRARLSSMLAWHEDIAQHSINAANEFAQFFGLRRRLSMDKALALQAREEARIKLSKTRRERKHQKAYKDHMKETKALYAAAKAVEAADVAAAAS